MGSEEHRVGPRVRLDNLAYVNLSSGNGGIVLDVSDEGLGFQAAASLEAAGPIRFRLLVGSIDQIEAAGELRWIDQTGKRAGLRFTDLPDEVRDQVRIWLGQPRLTPARILDAPPSPAAEVESVPVRRRVLIPIEEYEASHPTGDGSDAPFVAISASLNRAAALRNPPQPRFSAATRFLSDLPLRSPAPASPESRPSIFAHEHGLGEPTALAPARTNVSVPNHSASIVFFLTLGIAIGISSFVYKGLAGESLIRLGQRISGGSGRHPAVRVPAAISGSRADSASVANQPANTRDTHLPSTQAEPNDRPGVAARPEASIARPEDDPSEPQSETGQQTEAGLQPRSPESAGGYSARVESEDRSHEVSRTGENGAAELAFARRYLGEGGVREGSGRAAQLLWLAVEKGSTAAEVELARLYVRGEGVPKNCEQARVLLTAASYNEDSQRTEEELAEMRLNGCR
jgi:PilZ domain